MGVDKFVKYAGNAKNSKLKRKSRSQHWRLGRMRISFSISSKLRAVAHLRDPDWCWSQRCINVSSSSNFAGHRKGDGGDLRCA